ncbi:hypothetical protein [Corynebacterium uterequi]|uniref:Cell wall anchor protein n=1 Tax=Corynebacterium uterequi TaxID=1072256 RepID=A0A0G3HK04_9CORY|nr:hypothetical protein [Corynebacterium uterequi]AKK11477.1 hypothetical protein CUTER_07440 [Corynebacterium uterequi]
MSPKNSHSAGAFDIRNVIGILLGIYGLVLVASHFLLDPGVNVETGMAKESIYNLWAGLGMLVVGLGMIAWAKARPIIVEEPTNAA